MLDYLQRLAWDPTAPVPAGWPRGWWGVLLLFCVPGGVGVPPGVLLGQHDGLGPAFMTVLYFFSDIVLACVFEPLLLIVARAAPPIVRRARAALAVAERTMPGGSLTRPSGVMLVGFGGGLPFGRALAAMAGYAFVQSWLLTISGDMVYFLLGMASTLWFNGLFGDQRAAALGGVAVMIVVPFVVHRLRERRG